MPRRCSVCTSPKRQRIDQELAAAVPVQRVAASFGIPSSNLYRHRMHAGASMLREATVRPDMSGGDLLARMAEVLDDLKAARLSALATGNAQLLVRAATASADVLRTLFSELGITNISLTEEVRAAERLARVVGKIARADQGFAAAVASELRNSGDDDSAAEIERIAATGYTMERSA